MAIHNEDTLGGFPEEVISGMQGRVHPIGAGKYTLIDVACNVGPNLKYAANALVDVLQMSTRYDFGLTGSDIENYLTALVQMRCLQVGGKMPRNMSARDIPVPDFFRPFLAAICKYDEPGRALILTPVFAQNVEEIEMYEEAPELRAVTDPLMSLDEMIRISRRLKVLGVRCTDGLPRSLVTSRDGVFRIREDEDGWLLGVDLHASNLDLLIRSVVRLAFCGRIFGAPLTRYVSVEELHCAIEAVISTGVVFND